jgi:hypothetical protein
MYSTAQSYLERGKYFLLSQARAARPGSACQLRIARRNAMTIRVQLLAFLASAIVSGSALAEGTIENPPTGSSSGGFGNTGPGTTTTPPPGAQPTSPPSGYGSGRTTAPSSDTMDTAPMVLVVPTYFAMDPNVGNGCWARLFDSRDFAGTVFAMVGPVDIPSNRAGFITGFESGRNYDSVMVGSTATLTVWDRDNFQNKSTTFTAGEAIPDLNTRMGAMEEIRSMRLSCNR